MTSSAESSAATACTLGRGVMTSAAVSRAKVRLRFSSDAVSSSRRPALAERRTRLESSSAVRAPESSSFGSMPTERSTPLALPLSTTTAGRNTVVNATWNGRTSFAVCRGTASAKFFGTSSPMIIEKIVATDTATITASGLTRPSGRPQAVSTGRSRFEIAGSIV
jgi:hypothetical protein